MGEKIYTLKLTARELWYLREGYDASFTEPESKNQIEARVAEKLETLSSKAYADKNA